MIVSILLFVLTFLALVIMILIDRLQARVDLLEAALIAMAFEARGNEDD